jgi:hypothetical protein
MRAIESSFVASSVGRMLAFGLSLGACNAIVDVSDYRFDGAGGGSATTASSVGPGGAGGGTTEATTGSGSGGSGPCMPSCANKQCGPDGCGGICGECPDGDCSAAGTCCPSSWAVRLPDNARRISLSNETHTLFVSDENGGVRRLATCDGTPVPGPSKTTLPAGFAVRALGLSQGEVVAAGFGMNGVHAYRIDPATMNVLPGSTALPGASYPDDVVLDGTVAPDGSFWIGANQDAGGVFRLSKGSSACRLDFHADTGGARGIAATPDALAMGLMKLHAGKPMTSILRASWSDLSADGCSSSKPPSVSDEVSGEAIGIASSGSRVFAAMIDVIDAGKSRAVLARFDPGTPSIYVVLDTGPALEAFTAAASDGSTVFAAGLANGSYDAVSDTLVDGDAKVWRYPNDFSSNTQPSMVGTIGGGAGCWDVELDKTGVYVVGRSKDGGGFAVKCTTDLQCPDLPTP